MACLFCLFFFYAKKIKTNRGYKEEEVEKVCGVERKKYIGPIDQNKSCVSCVLIVCRCVVYMCVAAQCCCCSVFSVVVVDVYKRRGHQREGVRVYNL